MSIPEIDALAADYVKERDKRTKLTPREIAAKGKLIEAIQKHRDEIGVQADGTITYRHDGQIITVEPGKVKLTVNTEKVDGQEE